MIIDKTQKNKMVNSNNNNISANTVKCGEVNDFIQQKIKGLEKIENVLVKQQNKINALKDQTIKLE